jgi:hypothetical protein
MQLMIKTWNLHTELENMKPVNLRTLSWPFIHHPLIIDEFWRPLDFRRSTFDGCLFLS